MRWKVTSNRTAIACTAAVDFMSVVLGGCTFCRPTLPLPASARIPQTASVSPAICDWSEAPDSGPDLRPGYNLRTTSDNLGKLVCLNSHWVCRASAMRHRAQRNLSLWTIPSSIETTIVTKKLFFYEEPVACVRLSSIINIYTLLLCKSTVIVAATRAPQVVDRSSMHSYRSWDCLGMRHVSCLSVIYYASCECSFPQSTSIFVHHVGGLQDMCRG